MYFPREDSYMLAVHVEALAKGKVLDMGTGSGIQALAAARNKDVESVLAVDIDKETIAYCKKNIKDPKISFKVSDLFSNVKGKFDTIVFNPPYLPQDKGVDDPALYGGKKGHELIEKFFQKVSVHLAKGGIIIILFSSLTTKDKVDGIIKKKGFMADLLDKKHFFFEELYVYLVKKVK